MVCCVGGADYKGGDGDGNGKGREVGESEGWG